MGEIRFLVQGETGLVVEFGNEIDPVINTKVHALSRRIGEKYAHLVDAVVPTYRSLLVFFDPMLICRNELIVKIEATEMEIREEETKAANARTVMIPTLYGGEEGPDLEFVAQYNKLATKEVIGIHSSVPYRIYMMGFTPGFPYLGGMSERIATPRLKTPRTKIPAGSVGIAGTQTGLYPVESPGGWQLIGRTPLKVFDPLSQQPFLFAAGDCLKFEPISSSEYARIQNEVAQGRFSPRVLPSKEVAT